MSSEDDLDLIHRIRHRDPEALAELYRQYGNLVFSLAVRILQSAAQAEEVTQDIFLQFWTRPEAWDARKGRFVSWLLTVTRYTAIERWRREHHVRAQQPLTESVEGPAVADPGHDTLWLDGQILRDLMVRLPAEQQRVIELAFFQGFTHSEIARLLDTPLGTVKTRVRLALHKLKSLWQETNPP